MEDLQIIELYFVRDEQAIKETAAKWQRSIKKYCENTNLCQVNGKYETSM